MFKDHVPAQSLLTHSPVPVDDLSESCSEYDSICYSTSQSEDSDMDIILSDDEIPPSDIGKHPVVLLPCASS